MFLQFLISWVLLVTSSAFKTKTLTRNRAPNSQSDFVGCPANNDFYYQGNITSPLYPYSYPPNDKCFYYVRAEPGKVLKLEFSHFELESCCDYVTIYDGPTNEYPVLVQIGGPNANVTKPDVYYTTTRNAVMVFESNNVIQKSGFVLEYESVDSVAPCNRDILMVVNGMSGVGTQDNFVKQVEFIANQLTPTWNVGLSKVRVMLNLQVDADYATVWTADDLPTNADLTTQVLIMEQYVPDVTQNNNTDLESLFRYAYDALEDSKTFDERYGIEQVVIVFVAENAHGDQDYNESFEFAHKIRTEKDAKVIVIGMGGNLNQDRIAKLAYAQGFAFFSSYADLSTLIPQINNAICANLNSQCGP